MHLFNKGFFVSEFIFVLQKNIFVADLTEEMVTSTAQALAWISKGESKRLLFVMDTIVSL